MESPDLAAAKDSLIDALTKENGDLKVQVLNLTAARDSWKGAYEDECKAANLREIALKAQISATKAKAASARPRKGS